LIKRLRTKFVLINMSIVLAMLLVIFGTVYESTKRNLETESILMLQSVASESGMVEPEGKHARLPYFTLQLSIHGKVLAIGGDQFDLSDEAFLREIVDAALSSDAHTGVVEAHQLRFFRALRPTGLTIVYADISSERAVLQTLVRNSALIGLGSGLAFLLISIFFARWAVRPVEKAWKQQRQFVADASHELKTPLTVIMTNAELLQEPDLDPDRKQQFAGNILTMSIQMRSLVERLLELARVDNGMVQTAMGQVAFSSLAKEAVLPFEALFFEQNMTLYSQIQEDIIVKGSEAHLRQLIEIFLDNAMKYGSRPGWTEVSLHCQGNSCLLVVSNTGEPIAAKDLKNIFKRFYRVDQARTMNRSYGLGLSIAETIVRDHRGKIWVESQQGINRFFVQLPL